MQEIKAQSGLIGIWDSSVQFPEGATMSELVETLRKQSRAGEVFFLEIEDPVTYRIEVLVDKEIGPTLAEELEERGGVFRLRISSGDVQADCIPPENSGIRLKVPPGEYLVQAYARRPFDGKKHAAKLRKIIGEGDWRFRQRIDAIGAFGCLSFVIAFILGTVSYTRGYWWLTFSFLLIPWLLYFSLRKLPKYKRVEQLEQSYEKKLPHFLFLLTNSPAAKDIPGGWIKGEL